MKRFVNLILKIGISILIAIGFGVWIESKGIKLIPPKDYFSSVRWDYVLLYIVFLSLVHFFRAYRWYYLVKPLNPQISPIRTTAIAFVGFMAIMLLPLRTGEFARPYFISTTGNISMSSGLGTIAIERVIDGLLLSMVLTICLLLLPEGDYPNWVNYIGWLTFSLFLFALIILIIILIFKDRIIVLFERLFFFLPKKILLRILSIIKGFIDGLTSLPDKKALFPFIFFTFIYWGINGFSMWELAKGCGIELPLIAGYTVMSILAVGILLPTGPGLFGNFQAGIYLAFTLYLPEAIIQRNGAVYIFIIYTIQVALTVILGTLSMFTSHISFKKIIVDQSTV